jgi:hypothetical protein
VIRGSVDVSDGNELGRGLATKMDSESVALLNEALGREVISRPSSDNAPPAAIGRDRMGCISAGRQERSKAGESWAVELGFLKANDLRISLYNVGAHNITFIRVSKTANVPGHDRVDKAALNHGESVTTTQYMMGECRRREKKITGLVT